MIQIESGFNRRAATVIILLGASARFWLWWISIGSNDAVYWFRFGESIAKIGLAATYENIQLYNHPPLMGLYSMEAWRLSGGDMWTFAHLLKLPGLAGEALTIWALWRFCSSRASVVYACLPSAILISGFHGNTDCLYSALVLLTMIAYDKRRFFIAGVLLAAALNVKLIPLALLPLVFIGLPNRAALMQLVSGLAVGVLPFVAPALSAGPAMYRNMVAYNSLPDNWGLLMIMNLLVSSPDLGKFWEHVRDIYLSAGRYCILAGVAAVALAARYGRKMALTEQAAIGAALFLLLTPGFGVQYVAFVAPLLCFVDVKTAMRWGWVSGVFIGIVYWSFRIPSEHLASFHTGGIPVQAWLPGVAAWVVLLQFVWHRIRRAGCRELAVG